MNYWKEIDLISITNNIELNFTLSNKKNHDFSASKKCARKIIIVPEFQPVVQSLRFLCRDVPRSAISARTREKACMLMAGKGEGRVMRRRRKSVRNVDDHRRGSIMARISRFYYFNAGPDRRGPRDSHTHSPILAWESFHSPPLSASFSLSILVREFTTENWSFRGHLMGPLRNSYAQAKSHTTPSTVLNKIIDISVFRINNRIFELKIMDFKLVSFTIFHEQNRREF